MKQEPVVNKWTNITYWMDRVGAGIQERLREGHPAVWLVVRAYNWRRMRSAVSAMGGATRWDPPKHDKPPTFMGLNVAVTPCEADILEVR